MSSRECPSRPANGDHRRPRGARRADDDQRDRRGERRADDGERLAALESRLRLLVVHLAGRAILARVEPDDLVQEVFVRALTAPGGLPPVDPERPGDPALFALLARIARNTVVDVARTLRARKRAGRTDPLVRSEWSRVGVVESRVAAADAGPLTRAVGGETETGLVRAYRSLEPDHRRVIGLRQFEGLSAAETARRMGRSETAVHSLYRRALAAWQEAGG